MFSLSNTGAGDVNVTCTQANYHTLKQPARGKPSFSFEGYICGLHDTRVPFSRMRDRCGSVFVTVLDTENVRE